MNFRATLSKIAQISTDGIKIPQSKAQASLRNPNKKPWANKFANATHIPDLFHGTKVPNPGFQ